jgi:hypothetical protein
VRNLAADDFQQGRFPGTVGSDKSNPVVRTDDAGEVPEEYATSELD